MKKQTAADLMKTLGFGVEIEMANISHEKTARVIAKHYGTENTVRYIGSYYNKWVCEDNKGRTWTAMSDSSIHSDNGESAEMVTPILKYEDIEDLQQIVRDLRAAKAVSNPAHDCGVHIHVSEEGQNAATLRNLTNIMASHEKLLAKALGIDRYRLSQWCKVVNPEFVNVMNVEKPKTMADLKYFWYKANGADWDENAHYNSSRYHMLNLHSLFQGKGIEYRLFQFNNPDGTSKGGLHAGMLKSYIQISLAITAEAMLVRTASPKEPQRENEKYAMRTWLLRLGFIGDEFKTARDILTRNLDGDASFRHGREAA